VHLCPEGAQTFSRSDVLGQYEVFDPIASGPWSSASDGETLRTYQFRVFCPVFAYRDGDQHECGDRVGGVLQGGAGERYHRSREPNFLSCLVLHQDRVFRSAHRVIRDDRAFTLRHILASEILLSKSGSNGGAWDHKADIGNLQPCADDYHVVGHRSRQFCVLADYPSFGLQNGPRLQGQASGYLAIATHTKAKQDPAGSPIPLEFHRDSNGRPAETGEIPPASLPSSPSFCPTITSPSNPVISPSLQPYHLSLTHPLLVRTNMYTSPVLLWR